MKTLTRTTDGDCFYEFTQTHLLPHLMPFNGFNPHSVVIMDNCSVHHVHEVIKSIQDVGALIHFLPPYSPDFNPIEEAFSKVKRILPFLEIDNTILDIETLVLASFAQITQQDCQNWIFSTGVYY